MCYVFYVMSLGGGLGGWWWRMVGIIGCGGEFQVVLHMMNIRAQRKFHKYIYILCLYIEKMGYNFVRS